MINEKRNLRKIMTSITIVLFIYVLSLSFGYAYFNETLTINGVASTVDYYEGTKLPTSPIIQDTTNNYYYTANGTKSNLVFDGESWSGDTYNLAFMKKFGIVAGQKTITYTVSFSNPTVLTMTNGKVTTEILKANSGGVKSHSATISTTELQPNEIVTVAFTVTFNFLTRLNDDRVQAVVTYDLQGQTRYFYFIIDYYD